MDTDYVLWIFYGPFIYFGSAYVVSLIYDVENVLFWCWKLILCAEMILFFDEICIILHI